MLLLFHSIRLTRLVRSAQWFEKGYDPDSKEFYYVRRIDNR